MIHLRWLPVNQAWVFLFGRDVATASLCPMHGRTLFALRKEAVEAATACGLMVASDGTVEVIPSPITVIDAHALTDEQLKNAVDTLLHGER